MVYVIAAPEMMAAAATDVATIGSNVCAAHMVAAAPTLAVVPAAADEVSASIAHLFSAHAQGYQALAGKAAAFQEQFVQHLTAGAGSYVATEAANASLLQPLTAIEGAFTSAIASLNSVNNFLAQLGAFAFDVAFLSLQLLLVASNFFVFLINSGVPLALFGVVIFPGF
jgi:hypothetical protein